MTSQVDPKLFNEIYDEGYTQHYKEKAMVEINKHLQQRLDMKPQDKGDEFTTFFFQFEEDYARGVGNTGLITLNLSVDMMRRHDDMEKIIISTENN